MTTYMCLYNGNYRDLTYWINKHNLKQSMNFVKEEIKKRDLNYTLTITDIIWISRYQLLKN